MYKDFVKYLLNYLLHCFILTFLCVLMNMSHAFAAALPSEQDKSISDKQLIYQQERQAAIKNALSGDEQNVQLSSNVNHEDTLYFPDEKLCFAINTVKLINNENMPYTMQLNQLTKQAEGKCLGGEGINLLMSELQNSIISYGYITSRVVAPEQDLTSGVLFLLLVNGTLNEIYYQDGSDKSASLMTAIPTYTGEILNLRDIEQGIENLQRIPTASAKMQLVPGNKPGESDVVISREQSKYLRLGLSLDDSGTKDTGRTQGGATLYLDNPLGLSDSFYVSGGRDLGGDSSHGSNNYLFSYSGPIGYWNFSASKSGNTYHQVIAGVPDYEYSGRSKSASFVLSRVISRNKSQKTTVNTGVNLRESSNYIDDTEVEVQRRKTTNWSIGVNHRHYFNDVTFDLGVNYKKGVRWFGAQKAPEEYGGFGTALSEIIIINGSLNVPFNIKDIQFRYNADFLSQFTSGANLTPPDRFSIGSRWSVRGFDGELSLSADNGWYIRNDFAWTAPFNNELYLALDYGEVSGANSGYLLGHQLAGTALGIRGGIWGFSYDAFAGTPVYKPTGFRTDDVTLGFSLSWNY